MSGPWRTGCRQRGTSMLSGPGAMMVTGAAADAGWGAEVAMPYTGELHSSALQLTRHRADAEDLADVKGYSWRCVFRYAGGSTRSGD